MKTKYLTGPALVAGVLAFTAPAQSASKQPADNPPPSQASRYSDRDRSVDWNKQKESLEQALKLGEAKDRYRRDLEKMGWVITAVNYDKPDYVEWEIVKGEQTYEVQIDIDKSNRASKIDVTTNMWKADATKKALKGEKVVAGGRGDARFSDRDRRADWTKNKEDLERALKPGMDKAAYRRDLEKLGWKITSVNSDKPDYAEWEIVKGDQSYEVQIDFDKSNQKATKIDVTTNMWQAEATERALEGRRSSAAPARRGESSAMTSPDDLRQAQKKLNDLGFDAGNPDGVWGRRTEAALRNFQQSKNLQVTGRLDNQTVSALGMK